MRSILAIDPGTTESGVVRLGADGVRDARIVPNIKLAESLRDAFWEHDDLCAIEMVASYGMPVGREVFETCVWIGRFVAGAYKPPLCVYRKDVKLHLCGQVRAKDANIRQALLDKFPATGGGKTPVIGTKAKPGPLYGVKSHCWAALAVAVTVQELGAEAFKRFGEVSA